MWLIGLNLGEPMQAEGWTVDRVFMDPIASHVPSRVWTQRSPSRLEHHLAKIMLAITEMRKTACWIFHRKIQQVTSAQ